MCKKNLKECMDHGHCPLGEFKCPDGTCTVDTKFCRCPSKSPFKCFDGTCKKSLKECKGQGPTAIPVVPCPAGTIMCADGTCKKNLEECMNHGHCPLGEFKCPDGTCT